jgi:hypothetical protein
MTAENMSILDAATLFKHADNVRTQLDFISASSHASADEHLQFNNLIRVIDKIYMSPNTREYRVDLKNFILFNSDAIYKKYVELTQKNMMDDCYKIDI